MIDVINVVFPKANGCTTSLDIGFPLCMFAIRNSGCSIIQQLEHRLNTVMLRSIADHPIDRKVRVHQGLLHLHYFLASRMMLHGCIVSHKCCSSLTSVSADISQRYLASMRIVIGLAKLLDWVNPRLQSGRYTVFLRCASLGASVSNCFL